MKDIQYTNDILEKIKNADCSTDLVLTLNIPKKDIDDRIKYLKDIPQPVQKSVEWLNQRTSFITASTFGHAIADKWNYARTELLKEKISFGQYKPFTGNEATRWGEKYEIISNDIYCYRNKTTIHEFGMIAHTDPKLYFIGASTDGISNELINIEIKSPFSRIITSGQIKSLYWKQMQLQMAVLELELTHFIECRFKEYNTAEDFWDDFDYPSTNIEKGIIIEYFNTDDAKTKYIYSPLPFCTNILDLKLWQKRELFNIINSNNVYIREHYWLCQIYSCVNVARDKEWFDQQIPLAIQFWNEVLYYRKNGGIEAVDKDFNNYKQSLLQINPDIDVDKLLADTEIDTYINPNDRTVLKKPKKDLNDYIKKNKEPIKKTKETSKEPKLTKLNETPKETPKEIIVIPKEIIETKDIKEYTPISKPKITFKKNRLPIVITSKTNDISIPVMDPIDRESDYENDSPPVRPKTTVVSKRVFSRKKKLV